MGKIKALYNSKAWRDLSHRLKIENGCKCQRCGDIMLNPKLLIGHHTIELTENNALDASVALNPNLIEILCIDCHNKEHRRFSHEQQRVYVVWGSPLSGKTTAVHEMMSSGDIVLDIDAIWQAITFQPEHIKPSNIKYNVFALKNLLLDQIKTRYGKWRDAYVITSEPNENEVTNLTATLGAELIYIEASREECLARAKESGRPDEWISFINNWHDKNPPQLPTPPL